MSEVGDAVQATAAIKRVSEAIRAGKGLSSSRKSCGTLNLGLNLLSHGGYFMERGYWQLDVAVNNEEYWLGGGLRGANSPTDSVPRFPAPSRNFAINFACYYN